jgi:hypothetical protein
MTCPSAVELAADPTAAWCPTAAIPSEGVSSTMSAKTLICVAVLACGAVALAEEKKGDKSALSGSWAKKGAELKIEFADKDVVKIVPHGDAAIITIVCTYTVDKEGLVKAKVTGLEGKDEVKKKLQEKIPVGFKFNFKWQAKGDAAKLADVSGDDVDIFKAHMEGDFEKK